MNKRKEMKEIANAYYEEYSQKGFKELLSLEYPIDFEEIRNNKRYKVEIIRVIEDETYTEFVDICICVSNNLLTSLVPVTACFLKCPDERIE